MQRATYSEKNYDKVIMTANRICISIVPQYRCGDSEHHGPGFVSSLSHIGIVQNFRSEESFYSKIKSKFSCPIKRKYSKIRLQNEVPNDNSSANCISETGLPKSNSIVIIE